MVLVVAACLFMGCDNDEPQDDPCENVLCDAPRICVAYYGYAGILMTSCEISCAGDPNACPANMKCESMADGPSEVCN